MRKKYKMPVDFDDEAKRIAIKWFDEYKFLGGLDISNRQKLAADFMNYALSKFITYKEFIKEMKKLGFTGRAEREVIRSAYIVLIRPFQFEEKKK